MRMIVVAMLLVLYAGSAYAQSAPVFAPNGQYLGTAVKNGNTTVFVDKNGKYGGAVIQNHNGMTILDKNGQHSIRPPQGNGYGPGGYGNRPPHPYPAYGNHPPHHYHGYGNRPPNGYYNGYGHHY